MNQIRSKRLILYSANSICLIISQTLFLALFSFFSTNVSLSKAKKDKQTTRFGFRTSFLFYSVITVAAIASTCYCIHVAAKSLGLIEKVEVNFLLKTNRKVIKTDGKAKVKNKKKLRRNIKKLTRKIT